MFGQVIMYELFNKNEKTICNTPEEVVKFINEGKAPTEYIGTKQIKPCFDVDLEMPKNHHFEEVMSLSKWGNNIAQILKNPKQKLDIKIIERPKREKGDNIKYSYHFVVNNIRISPANLKKLIIDNAFGSDKPFDQSIYRDGGLYPVYSNKKYNPKTKKIEEIPQLVPIDMFKMKDMTEINIFDYCPSYIQEDFEDWDAKMIPIQTKEAKYDDDDDDKDTGTMTRIQGYNDLNIEEIITKLSASRADNYDEWLNMMFCIMNIGDKMKMKRSKIREICQVFSAKCQAQYDEDDIDKKFYSIYDKKRGKGYRYKYLLDCLKKDDPEYYYNIFDIFDNHISKPKDIDDDVDASEVIIRKYGQMMVCCNSVKYVKKDNIWTCNDSIVSSTIYNWIVNTPMILKVSEKKKINYNRDKVYIKKCLDVIMNTAFVNDNPTFIKDNLIKSKDYLPFKNGIYSIRDKKLYSYDEIDIQFTQQIDRDFPEQNDDKMKELIKRVIEPIFPYEEERNYFFFILSRALAGRYEDKKWYINKGSRNSGKGVITKMLQNSFKKFVGIFNSGAFVVKQFQNGDDAKNLSWVCGKKDCRLIISNEVKEKTILDGVLIKSLSSGGDTVLARTNHKDEYEFTPQFMMMFMLNDLKGVDPIDALENCEQFYCKSKFVQQEDLIEGQAFLKLRDENIKEFIETPEAIDAFTLYVLHHFQDQLQVPESVKVSTENMVEDIPLTLEQILLKYFRSSSNNKDRLFTDDIIKHIQNVGYDQTINPKELSEILQKCCIGTRKKNGLTNINTVKKSGYENIKFIIPENSNNEEDEED